MNKTSKREFNEEHLRQVSSQKVEVLAQNPITILLQTIDGTTNSELEGLIVLICIIDKLDSATKELVTEETLLKIRKFIKKQGENKEDESN